MADKILVDPLGRELRLHDSGWHGHILKRHPELRSLRSRVERAVEMPLRICFSTSDLNCRLCFGSTASGGMMVSVVGDLAAGVIRTAYRSSRMKGVTEWQP